MRYRHVVGGRGTGRKPLLSVSCVLLHPILNPPLQFAKSPTSPDRSSPPPAPHPFLSRDELRALQGELDQQLHKEVFYGGIERIRALRAQGADLESRDMLGMTPLMKAILRPRLLGAAKVLLQLGANMNAYLHADPCIHNDDGNTPLELARQNGHVNLVRAIEGRVYLFQGWMREKYAPCSFMKRMIWAVVLPYEVQNPTRPRPLKLLLAIYLASQNMPACKPRAVIELWQSRIEKKLDEEDPCITIFDKETEYRYEILSADEGDKEKLQQFYDACHGIAQVAKTDPGPILDSSPTSSSLAPSELLAPSVDDVELAMAISASIQSAVAEGLPNVQPTTSTANMDDRGNPASNSHNGRWQPPDAQVDTLSGEWVANSSSSGKGSTLCVICLDAPVEGVCVPCGHMAFCMPCLEDIESKNGVCPICRATINQVLRLYPV